MLGTHSATQLRRAAGELGGVGKRSIGPAAAALGFAFWGTAAPAQTPPSALPSREELNPAARAPRVRLSQVDLFSAPTAGPCPLAESTLTFQLNSVVFTGASAEYLPALERRFARERGRTISVAEVCSLRDEASRALFSQGLLARVEIPPQSLEGGTLTLEVIEAKIVNVRVRGDVGPGQDAVERYLSKLRNLAPFDLDVAQRYLLLASDVPGMRVRGAIRPSTSSEDRGAVDLDVTVTRDPYGAVANVQNFGSEAIGRWGGLVRGDLNSFTPLGEQSSLTLYSTLEGDEQQVIQFVETARLGGEGLTGRLSLVYGVTKPGEALEVLDLESDAFVAEAELAYPVIRSRRRNLNVAAGFSFVDQETEIGGLGTLADDKLRVAYLRTDGDAQLSAAAIPVAVQGAVELRQGLSGFGASEAGDPLLSRFDGEPDAFVLRVRGSAEALLAEKFSVRAIVQAQHADSPLLSYEQLPIGNLTIGRGYDPASISGDKGIAAAFEARFGPFRPTPSIPVQAYAFYDVAHVEALGLGALEADVASVGGGIRMNLTPRLNLDVAYAHPLDEPFTGFGEPDDRLLVSLTANF